MAANKEYSTKPLSEIVNFAIGGDWGKDPTYHSNEYIQVKVIRGTEFAKWNDEKASSAALRKIKKSSLEKRKLKIGDLVIEISGGGPNQPVGRTIVIDEELIRDSDIPLVCSNFFRLVRLNDDVVPKYIKLALDYQYQIGEVSKYQTSSTNLRNLNFTDYLNNIELPIYDKQVQQEIADTTESLLRLSTFANIKIQRAKTLIKKFRQSILSAAVSGAFTEEWRTQNPESDSKELLARAEMERKVTKQKTISIQEFEKEDYPLFNVMPETWSIEKVGNLSIVQGGIQKTPSRAPKNNAYPYLRVANVYRGCLNLEQIEKFEITDDELETLRLKKGDLLIVEGNGSVTQIGRCAIWNDEIKDCVHQNHIIRCRPFNFIESEFLLYYLNSPIGIDTMVRISSSTSGLNTLSVSKIKNILMPLPPYEEQKEIVRRVKVMMEVANRVEKQIESSCRRAEKLNQAILAKAFKGELISD